MRILVRSPCTTSISDGLCAIPCLVLPSCIIRYQRVKCSTLYKHELPGTCTVQRISRYLTHQSPCFKAVPRTTQDLRRRIEIIPVKGSHTRIKPLALASGHGRYGTWPLSYTRTGSFVRWRMAVTYNRYKFVTVSLLKRLRNGRFTSETVTLILIQKWFKKSVGASRKF